MLMDQKVQPMRESHSVENDLPQQIIVTITVSMIKAALWI